MQCINGLLILTAEEKAAIEADTGPLASYKVEDVRLKLIYAAERKEAEGHKLDAEMIRITLKHVSAFAGSSA